MDLANGIAIVGVVFSLYVFFRSGRDAAARINDTNDYLYAGFRLPGAVFETRGLHGRQARPFRRRTF